MERVENLMWKLKALKKDPEYFISNYFAKVKNDVDLRRELLIQDINNYSDQMIDQIEKTKKECMELSTQIEDISTLLESYDVELKKLKESFNTLDADKLERMMEDSIRQCRHSLLQKKYFSCQFEEINAEKIFGKVLLRNIGDYILEREIEIDVDAEADISYFFGNNDMIATSEYDEEEDVIKIWNAKTGSLIKQLDREAPVHVAFDQNRYMAVGYYGAVPYIGDIIVYDTEDNFKSVITLNHGGQYLNDMDDDKYMAFSQNTKKNFFISAQFRGTVKVWDTETWTLQFTAHDTKAVEFIAFGQNNLVATSSNEGTIKIWNCDTWELVQTLEEKTEYFNEVVFTQNNMLVVLKENITNSKIKIWCSESWSLVKQLESKKPKFCSLALSKSNLLAVGCDDGKILIFNTENWDLFQELESLFRITLKNPIAFARNDFLSSVTGGKVRTWRKLEDMVFD